MPANPLAARTQLSSWFRQVGSSPLNLVYSPQNLRNTTGTFALAIDTLRAIPYVSGRGGTLDNIYFEVSTGLATAVGRVGIYTSTSDTNIYPDALVVDSGEFDCSTAGVKSASISVTLEPNKLYWFASLHGVAAATIRLGSAPQSAHIMGDPSTLGGTTSRSGFTVSQAYGALPSTFTASATFATGGLALVCVRYSA